MSRFQSVQGMNTCTRSTLTTNVENGSEGCGFSIVNKKLLIYVHHIFDSNFLLFDSQSSLIFTPPIQRQKAHSNIIIPNTHRRSFKMSPNRNERLIAVGGYGYYTWESTSIPQAAALSAISFHFCAATSRSTS